MNRIVKQHRGKEIHVVIDNPSTHKPRETRGWRGTRTSAPLSPTHARDGLIVCSEFGLKAAAEGQGYEGAVVWSGAPSHGRITADELSNDGWVLSSHYPRQARREHQCPTF